VTFPVAEQLRRLFDAVSTLAGLAVLVILGPGMLINAVTARVPEAGELVRIDGVTVECRTVVRGAALRLMGSGVGLYLVRTIVDLHEGAVALHSREGAGTRFEVRLPIDSAPPP
jgi:hypothetical protein